MSVKAIDRLIKKLDTDGDGEVDFKLRQKQNIASNNRNDTDWRCFGCF